MPTCSKYLHLANSVVMDVDLFLFPKATSLNVVWAQEAANYG